jgi:hypothetical protein
MDYIDLPIIMYILYEKAIDSIVFIKHLHSKRAVRSFNFERGRVSASSHVEGSIVYAVDQACDS